MFNAVPSQIIIRTLSTFIFDVCSHHLDLNLICDDLWKHKTSSEWVGIKWNQNGQCHGWKGSYLWTLNECAFVSWTTSLDLKVNSNGFERADFGRECHLNLRRCRRTMSSKRPCIRPFISYHSNISQWVRTANTMRRREHTNRSPRARPFVDRLNNGNPPTSKRATCCVLTFK